MDLASEIKNKIGLSVQNNELNNSDLISIIETCNDFLNLKTITEYAKSENISYNGALNRIKLNKIEVVELFGVKLIIDND